MLATGQEASSWCLLGPQAPAHSRFTQSWLSSTSTLPRHRSLMRKGQLNRHTRYRPGVLVLLDGWMVVRFVGATGDLRAHPPEWWGTAGAPRDLSTALFNCELVPSRFPLRLSSQPFHTELISRTWKFLPPSVYVNTTDATTVATALFLPHSEYSV